ncbi:MAG: DUF2807 domain-containing protein [Bacteroidales bacterium]|nr:DUF2807 domain-containing protein [Bacteroidales bacterium]
MKINILSLTMFLLLFIGSVNLHAETIKGNGNIVTKEFDVKDFDEITLSMPATINFTQSDQYSCSITIDENLVQFVGIKVIGDDLSIIQVPSKDGKPLLSFSFGEKELSVPKYQYPTLQFTKFEINISAPRLEDVRVNGSGIFNFGNEFSAYKLNANVNGSGQILSDNVLKIGGLDVEIAGSGSVAFAQVSADEAEVSISGSGSATVEGSFVEVDLKLMGSGNITLNGNMQTAKAKIAGSGNIHLGNVSKLLKYDIAGSGNVYYSGDAEARGYIAGSGIVQKK